MKVAIRVDASLQMGSGHVMRCLTLADALRQMSMQCHFFCRMHSGHLMDLVRSKGYTVHVLPYGSKQTYIDNRLAHAHWLGSTQEQDAKACNSVLQDIQPDWLIVDHYALDAHWESIVRPSCSRLMVIDDLADRMHQCDLLLDQNLGRQIADYQGLVPAECKMLMGPNYALLRPEFALLRCQSVKRRVSTGVTRILVSLGGVDSDNVTGRVLNAISHASLPANVTITIVMGAKAPWLGQIRQQAARLPWSTEVLVGIEDMAYQMAISDLAIGAAGSTSWERCALGLPTIMMILAKNQETVAHQLENVEAALVVPLSENFTQTLISYLHLLIENDQLRRELTFKASSVTDGQGTGRVVKRVSDWS
ncbi:UDP-2,4-diacetamido-2,4,6-trideoxy-beta-L-altropyranose hydrolase [Pseudomonas sp. JZ134]|uniref:UDP-2,4-diacetamido-2,4, 6-trideoxy-beta-L-altropyranose hydrolase n=1 Tax=Pseudomonas sp. JZ134 TaxID=2806615 RepID=UPI003DA02DF5